MTQSMRQRKNSLLSEEEFDLLTTLQSLLDRFGRTQTRLR
jgi:hypothetical protein